MSPLGFRLRTATASDAAAIEALLAASYPPLMASAYPPDVLRHALPLMTRANPALLACGTYYIAEPAVVDGPDPRPLGAGGWTVDEPGTKHVQPDVGHVRHFATHPAAVRRGIGRAIMDRCVGGAIERGIRELACFASLNAVPFYAGVGFEAVAPASVNLGGRVPFDCVRMRRVL